MSSFARLVARFLTTASSALAKLKRLAMAFRSSWQRHADEPIQRVEIEMGGIRQADEPIQGVEIEMQQQQGLDEQQQQQQQGLEMREVAVQPQPERVEIEMGEMRAV